MNKYTWKILINPLWWLRAHRTDKRLDEFFRSVLDHKDEVKIICVDRYTMQFEFRGDRYEVWISNKPYAYLSKIEWGWVEDKRYFSGGYFTKELDDTLPSRATALEFMETIEPNGPAKIKEYPEVK